MKGVWRALKRPRFIHNRDYLEAFFPNPNNKHLSNSELEQKVSFRIWFSMAIGKHEIETAAEIKTQIKTWKSQAARLRKEATQFRKHKYSGATPNS